MNTNKFNKYLAFSTLLILLVFGCAEDREPTAPTEIERPKSLSIIPSTGDLIVPLDSKILMVFDEPMDISTFDGHFTLKDMDGNLIAGIFNASDSIVNFIPNTALQKSTIYYAELKGRIRDANGNSIQVNYEPILDDTTIILSTWFYSAGDYSDNGFYNVYVRDKKDGRIILIDELDSVATQLTGLTSPEGLAISEDGNTLVICNTNKNEVILANAENCNPTDTFDVATNPTSCITFNNYAYVLSVNGKALTKINLTTKAIENSFVLNFFPGKLAISTDGNTIYTFDQVKRDLVLLNTTDGSIIKRVASVITNLVLGEIKVDAVTGNVYLCDAKGAKIKVTDSNGNGIQNFVQFASGIEPIDIIFNSSEVYAIAGNSIYRIDKSTGAIQDTISFSTNVKSLCIIPSGDIMYVTLATKIAVIDFKTFYVLNEIDLISTGIATILSNLKKF
jgi:sugar lactone lactonase YvrE